MSSVARTCGLILAGLTFCCGLQAQEICNSEVKLLLSATQAREAVPALHAAKESRAHIYFYDTPGLDLLRKGVILRIRDGSAGDLTAKFRPTAGERPPSPRVSLSAVEHYKCEIEMVGGVENRSYSVKTSYAGGDLPETGEELRARLSSGQKKLLEDSKVRIDWTSVKKVAAIDSTSWTVRGSAPLGKLSLEFWKWPNGRILEVSAKVPAGDEAVTYAALKELAKHTGLAMSPDQRSKTATALTAQKR